MKTRDSVEIAALVKAGRRVAERGLVLCSSGNLSRRAGPDLMLITATRSRLARLTPRQVAACRISDGESLGHVTPSAETPMHAAVLRARPDVNVVLHFQSPAATAVGCLRETPKSFDVIPEIPFYVGPVTTVPYSPPGSQALAAAAEKAMRSHDMALLRNHGALAVGRDFDSVIRNAVFFELSCRIILDAGACLRPMPRRQALLLRRKGREEHGGG